MVCAESLPLGKFGSGGYILRTSSVTGDINRTMNRSEYVNCCDNFFCFHFHFVNAYSLHLATYQMWGYFYQFICFFLWENSCVSLVSSLIYSDASDGGCGLLLDLLTCLSLNEISTF